MIETRDKQKFFTHEKNYDSLIEFSKACGAEISIVKVKEADVLDLVKLAPAICTTPEVKKKLEVEKKPEFEIIEFKISKQKNNRTKILRNAQKIRGYIKTELLSGEVLKLSEVSNKFARLKLTLACFCNHLKAVRDELAKENFVVERIGHGEYRIK
jgi:hypothetical protein